MTNPAQQDLSSTIDMDSMENDDDSQRSKIDNKKSVEVLPKPSIICRICHNNDDIESLISPCLCKGTMSYVHKDCLQRWLNSSGSSSCELCGFKFRTDHALRYRMFESLKLWFRHPHNRSVLQSDIILCFLLTFLTFGLIMICVAGMHYLASQSQQQMDPNGYWTETSFVIFLCIVVLAFILNAVIILRGNLIPWYRWWRQARVVQLVLIDNQNNRPVSN